MTERSTPVRILLSAGGGALLGLAAALVLAYGPLLGGGERAEHLDALAALMVVLVPLGLAVGALAATVRIRFEGGMSLVWAAGLAIALVLCVGGAWQVWSFLTGAPAIL